MTDGYIALSEISLWEDNPKDHDIQGLALGIRKHGLNADIGIRQGKLFAGHGRVEALHLIKKQGSRPEFDLTYPPARVKLREDGEWLIPFIALDHLDEAQARAYAIQDNLINQRGKFDRKALHKLFSQALVAKEDTSFTAKQHRTISEAGKPKKPRSKVSYQNFVENVPDASFPYEPLWNIPMLDPDRQAKFVDKPFLKWGTLARSDKHIGTVHFYTDDYKFSALDKNPLKLVDTQCVTVVEPNFTTHPQMPKYEVINRIGRKRWMARLWQEHGIEVLVDLCIALPFRDLNMLGIPRTWSAFATRAYTGQLATIQAEYDFVEKYCGDKPRLFVVYGGNAEIERYCSTRGWIWFPEHLEVAKKRRNHG